MRPSLFFIDIICTSFRLGQDITTYPSLESASVDLHPRKHISLTIIQHHRNIKHCHPLRLPTKFAAPHYTLAHNSLTLFVAEVGCSWLPSYTFRFSLTGLPSLSSGFLLKLPVGPWWSSLPSASFLTAVLLCYEPPSIAHEIRYYSIKTSITWFSTNLRRIEPAWTSMIDNFLNVVTLREETCTLWSH